MFEAGADDILTLPGSAGDGLFAIQKAVARRSGRRRRDRRRPLADDLRARAEGRHGQDAHVLQPRRRAREPGRAVAVVDLDLQFGDVGLALGLAPEKTIYDLAKSGGSLDAEKLEAYLRRTPSGVRVLMAPTRPDQAGVVTVEFLREVYALLRATHDYVIVDTPPGFTPEVIASIDSSSHICMVGMLDSLSLKNTKLGLETLELMGYDLEQVRLVLNRADSRSASRGRRRRSSAGSPDVLVPSDRDIPRSVNEGVPIVIAKDRSEARRRVPLRHARRTTATATTRRGAARRRRGLAGGSADGAPRAPLGRPPPGAAGADGADPFAELKNRVHLAVIGELGPAALQRRHGPERAARARDADIREQLEQEPGSRATTASGSRRDRRRHPRPRAARAAARRRQRHRRSWSTARTTSGSSARAAVTRRPCGSPTTRTCGGSSTRSSPRSAGAIDESSPMVDARLPDGSRVNAVIPPLSLDGPLVTIRKFSQERLDLDDLIRLGTLSTETVEFLERCVQARS